ncbi:siderophore-interacting protein [Streptomyces sp. PTY087I2]|uniref:siderophore-interacting protein n=1 Tax=Streptomyces sp. PTY087I2 TaxID=1819298 RepID=UPI00080B3985|nr:siderophore-interacting protein [Streptomyces sp. PTY087I2]OCC08779.1 Vibriobactin utilization protein ViuB [Streptomyces sp. PTY087I2]
MTSTTAATPEVAPLQLFDLTVVRTKRLGPSILRITLGGPGSEGFRGGGRDQSLSLLLPRPGQRESVAPAGEAGSGRERWRALTEGERALLRSYAVRAERPRPDGSTEVDLDFVLHGDGGPASRWARKAAPGDRITVLGPAVADDTAVRFRPPADTDWVLIRADETALSAAAAVLEWLPAGLPARVWLEVPCTEDRQALNTAAKARIRWLVRSEGAACGVEAVRAAALPEGTPYAWIAGEASGVRALRHHLVQERGFAPERVTSTTYWTRGLSAEQARKAESEGVSAENGASEHREGVCPGQVAR